MRTIRLTVIAGLISLPLALAAYAEEEAEAAACLDALSQGNYQEAVTLCTRATEIDPENERLQSALEIAKAAISGTGAVGSPPPRVEN